MNNSYVIGIDFGTDSVRSLIVDCSDGREISSAVHYYTRWKEGKYCDPLNNQYRQHPLDYIEGLELTVIKAINDASIENITEKIKGISIDTTGSTPVAVDEKCVPLSLKDKFKNDPDAMFILWKDHTAVAEADEINKKSKEWKNIDYTQFVGGVYSSEWYWAKILHVLRKNPEIRKNAYSWLEHCDWIPALLTGNSDPLKLKRSRCAAGHKAMWHKSYAGLPEDDFFTSIDPLLKGLRKNLYQDTFTNDQKVDNLCSEWAQRLGLSTDVVVGVGAFDAHMGAIGGEIGAYQLCKIIGTSTCDILVAPLEDIGDKLIEGICGQVDGSVLPGMLGMEAGQSAFGDIYAWFKDLLLWPFKNIDLDNIDINKYLAKIEKEIIPALTEKAQKLSVDESDIIVLDWMNGRRTPYANQLLKGVIGGLNLGSDAPRIFKALVEATAFGAKKIVERFIESGVKIESIIAMGGVARKSPFIMQILSDVLNMKIKVSSSDQACALGAAMCAATAAGIHPSLIHAQQAMGNGFEKEYNPISENVVIYNKLYQKYSRLAELIENNY